MSYFSSFLIEQKKKEKNEEKIHDYFSCFLPESIKKQEGNLFLFDMNNIYFMLLKLSIKSKLNMNEEK